MKIILSRKGMDSSWGGHPGVILPDNTLLYYPIPGDSDECCYSDILGNDGIPMDMGMKRFYCDIVYQGKRENITTNTHCHMDPDLDYYAKHREPGWRGTFGQADAAQTVLRKAEVGIGDLFLFFGWYQKWAVGGDDTYQRVKGSDLQCIFGYMEIGDIILTKDALAFPQWLLDHPHMLPRRINRESNCIYIAREKLSWDSNKSGYGLLTYDPKRVLTKKGLTRSKWDLPDFFRNATMAYHSEASWKEGYFQSAHRGQEFVISANSQIEQWAKRIIAD